VADASFILHQPPITSYLLQASRTGRARKRRTIKWATLVKHRDYVLRTQRLDSALDLVDVLTEISVEIAIVVAEVSPLQFAHSKLWSEAERTLTDVLLWNETLESLASDHETNLVVSSNPCWVTALSKAVRDGGANDRVDQDKVAVAVKTRGAQRLLVDTKSETAIPLELVATDAVLTQLERTSGQIEEILFDICVVADVFDGVSTEHDLEELTLFGGKRLRKHLFTKEGSDAIERLEVQSRVRKNLGELGVDLLHITSEVGGEGLGRVDHILHTRLNEILIADVSVDDLKDALLKADLSLKIAALESSASLLDADTRASTAKGLQAELVFGRTHLIRSSTDAAKRSVIHERRGSERSGRHCHFLDNTTNDIRDVGDSSAVDGVDIGGLTSKNLCNLSDDARDILGGKVLDGSKRDTIAKVCARSSGTRISVRVIYWSRVGVWDVTAVCDSRVSYPSSCRSHIF